MAEFLPGFYVEKVKNFFFDLHQIQNVKTRRRSAVVENARKICFIRKWKSYNIL